MNKISIILIGIVLLAVVLTSCAPEREYNLLLEEKETLNKEIIELKLTIKTYREIRYNLEEKIVELENQIADQDTSISEELKLYQDTYGMVYSGIQPPYRGLSSPILLVNKESSKNPTWAQLLEFLEKDKTEEGLYGFYGVCGDFAQELHNNSESNGLKAAFVVTHLYEEDPHAFNAFKTTDKGLVFVDCTGEPITPTNFEEWCLEQEFPHLFVKDRVVFLVKEKELGAVSLRSNLQLDYSSYLDMKLEQDLYSKEAERHNSEVERYSNEVERMVYIQGSSAYRKITEWNKTLEAKEEELYTILSQLNTVWPSLGVVKEIEIYW